jgi:hypothetical protein
MRNLVYLFLGLTLFMSGAKKMQAQGKEKGLEAISREAVEAQLGFLASDWTEGRYTGTKGEYMSGDYIASMFKLYGLKPGGDEGFTSSGRGRRMVMGDRTRSFFQTIPFIELSQGDENEFVLISETKDGTERTVFKYKTDFSYGNADLSIEKTTAIVFVGYGLVADSLGYNDFKGIDVKGKIILRLGGYPGRLDSSSLAFKNFHPRTRAAENRLRTAKNRSAKDAGAIGVIEYTAGSDPVKAWATNVPFRYNIDFYEGEKNPYDRKTLRILTDTLPRNVLNISLSTRALNELLLGTGIDFNQFEHRVVQTLKSESKILSGKKAYLKSTVNSKIINGRNVIGILEGEEKDNIIVVGGHYDHNGMFEGLIFNGADDNGSGTVGVLTMAKAFMASGVKPKKTIVFACWTGEEEGLLGSNYFIDHSYKPLKNIMMSLNFDMIARDAEDDSLKNRCIMTYTRAYSQLKDIASKNASDYKLKLNIKYESPEKPGGGSDHAPFAEKNIPVIYWEAAMHKDYHTPWDQVEKVNFPKMMRIIQLGFLTIWDLANQDGMLKKL